MVKIPSKELKSGFSLPVLGLGTWQIGGRFEKDPNCDKNQEIENIQKIIAKGVTHIDTAESYADGFTEEIVGEAIKSFPRNKIFLTSKVSSGNLHHDQVLLSFKNSLKRLQTDYLDLYLIHAPNPEIPLSESVKALNFLQKRGTVKNIGISNANTKSLKETISASAYPIVVNQVYYGLINREPEAEGVLRFCQENDILLTAYRPLEKGALLENTKFLKPLCEKYQKTPAQIVLNFLISQKNVTVITKMTNPEHLEENLGALGWVLEPKDLEDLKSNYPNQIKRSPTLPLR